MNVVFRNSRYLTVTKLQKCQQQQQQQQYRILSFHPPALIVRSLYHNNNNNAKCCRIATSMTTSIVTTSIVTTTTTTTTANTAAVAAAVAFRRNLTTTITRNRIPQQQQQRQTEPFVESLVTTTRTTTIFAMRNNSTTFRPPKRLHQQQQQQKQQQQQQRRPRYTTRRNPYYWNPAMNHMIQSQSSSSVAIAAVAGSGSGTTTIATRPKRVILLNALRNHIDHTTTYTMYDWLLCGIGLLKFLFNVFGTFYIVYTINTFPGVVPFGFLFDYLPRSYNDNDDELSIGSTTTPTATTTTTTTPSVVHSRNDHRMTRCEGMPSPNNKEESNETIVDRYMKIATTTTTTNDGSTTKSPTSATLTPSFVDMEDMQTIVDRYMKISTKDTNSKNDDESDAIVLPIFTLDEIAQYNGTVEGKPIYMTYGGYVYDVTNFIHNHPGGSDKILQAAGTAIEPYWYIYRQHYNSELPMKLMEHMIVGQLRDEDQNIIHEQMQLLEEEQNDPYANEPIRNNALKVLIDAPLSAEVPSTLLTKSYITPNDLFYIRNHHPVPYLTDTDIQNFTLQIDLSSLYTADDDNSSSSSSSSKDSKKVIKSFTLQDLYNMPKTDIIVTLQCSGNRRSGYNSYLRTSGTPWGQGAISTAKFTGVKLRDVLIAAGMTDPILAQEKYGIEHIRFYAMDDMSISIDIEKAMSEYGDCIIAYQMNDEPIPRDHGYPLRLIVPGYSGVRNIKWINKIELSKYEADSVWHRGLNYKPTPPSVTDASTVNLDTVPSISELSLYSGITRIERVRSSSSSQSIHPGDRVTIKVGGWAFGGGGRNIVRVDVTGDNGTTWSTATLKEGSQQRYKHAWAWTFWECDVEAVVNEDGSVHVASKAVDLAYNVQPESNIHMWNVRGLNNNSWYRAHAKILD